MLITVIIWGMDNVLVKSLLNYTFPTTILIYLRFIFATLIVGIILKIKNELLNGNKKSIAITSICWGTSIIANLRAYQFGNVTYEITKFLRICSCVNEW